MKKKLDDNRNKDGFFKVSQSKAKQWRSCRRQWWYAHVMRLQRRKNPRPLAFGSIVHKMKETEAAGKDPLKVLDELPRQDVEAYKDDPETYGDILTDIKLIYEAYEIFYAKERLKFLKRHGRTAEFPFEVEIKGKDIVVKGTIDAMTEHRKFNWLTEHKNHKHIPNDDERWRSVQSVVYIRINDILGWWKNVEGTCWDYIRTKPPTRPELTQKGVWSLRKIDTLPNVVRETVLALKGPRGLSDPAVKTMLDAATLNMQTYFQRIYTPVKKQLITQVWADFISTAEEMRDAPLTPPVRTIGQHCSWCQFEPICRASLSGGDEDFVIEHDYVPSTYGENHEESD